MVKRLAGPHGVVELPAFFPDATYGTVRATGMDDVRGTHTPGMVMNTYHLFNRPGARLVRTLGGLHAFTGWDGTILTDSGGFQLYSLIRENPGYGEIRDNEIIFRPDRGAEKMIFTPEKCIQSQMRFDSDVMMALDVCTHPDDSPEMQRRSVELTLKWGERCRSEYDAQMSRRAGKKSGKKRVADSSTVDSSSADDIPARPLLFGIVQGGGDYALREECGRELEQIGFDGYGFGGWPLDSEGAIRYDILKAAADAMPDNKIKYAMGLGRPEEIVELTKIGYSLFDCVIPTREARHQRLYAFKPGMDTPDALMNSDGKFYSLVYMLDDKHAINPGPIDEGCDCELCRKHSRAYLHHLFKIGDSQAYRLATIHNLRFYSRLMELLRQV